MIFVDSRVGSAPLERPLRAAGLDVELTTLPFGDLAFQGRGEKGAPVDIGIEFKTLAECIGSMRTGRLQGHQAPGIADSYDFRWLLIQGEILFDKKGIMLQWSRPAARRLKPIPGSINISEFEKRILGLQLQWGLNPKFTETARHTVKWIEACYRAWTDQDLDKHKSHLAIYQPASIIPMSDFRQAVAAWPGVGPRVSLAAERQFRSVRRAATASADEWANLTTTDEKGKTRRVGHATAQKLVVFLQGGLV